MPDDVAYFRAYLVNLLNPVGMSSKWGINSVSGYLDGFPGKTQIIAGSEPKLRQFREF
jgi:hypothetical protein